MGTRDAARRRHQRRGEDPTRAARGEQRGELAVAAPRAVRSRPRERGRCARPDQRSHRPQRDGIPMVQNPRGPSQVEALLQEGQGGDLRLDPGQHAAPSRHCHGERHPAQDGIELAASAPQGRARLAGHEASDSRGPRRELRGTRRQRTDIHGRERVLRQPPKSQRIHSAFGRRARGRRQCQRQGGGRERRSRADRYRFGFAPVARGRVRFVGHGGDARGGLFADHERPRENLRREDGDRILRLPAGVRGGRHRHVLPEDRAEEEAQEVR
mmetsp:Transcript_15392/g.36912  ORF Transcript_15392/g.36912 Transcript_15392/m.36912 type:complete len:270 (+) Transcript_15392:287-1096(+)